MKEMTLTEWIAGRVGDWSDQELVRQYRALSKRGQHQPAALCERELLRRYKGYEGQSTLAQIAKDLGM